jgi:Lon protease-like protein
VTEVQLLPEGRSNILTIGLIRYRLESYVRHDESYLVGRVQFFEDEEEDGQFLEERANEVSGLFMRIARAVRIINDERASLPELPPTEPERLSFLVAAAMELDTEVKLELLELRYTSERLKRLRDLLTRAVSNYEERARIHEIAKGNGHGGKKIEFE